MTTRDQLVDLLLEGTSETTAELGTRLGVSPQRVRQLLAELGATRTPAIPGRWQLPEHPRKEPEPVKGQEKCG